MIAVILPSRGLIHSRTIECVLENLTETARGYDLYFSHDLSIPECFNTPIERALKGKNSKFYSYIWFVEEDMYFDKYTLSRMIEMDRAVVSCDYADKKTGKGFAYFHNGEVVFTGMGCFLIRREVLKKLKEPYFKKVLAEIQEDGSLKLRAGGAKNQYGTHDVYFCLSLSKAGFKINLTKAKVAHLRLDSDINKRNGFFKVTPVYL